MSDEQLRYEEEKYHYEMDREEMSNLSPIKPMSDEVTASPKNRLSTCSICKGAGSCGGDDMCWKCHGSGQVERYRIIAHNPETKEDDDCGIIEARDWYHAASFVRCTYNYPRRMIPIPGNQSNR